MGLSLARPGPCKNNRARTRPHQLARESAWLDTILNCARLGLIPSRVGSSRARAGLALTRPIGIKSRSFQCFKVPELELVVFFQYKNNSSFQTLFTVNCLENVQRDPDFFLEKKNRAEDLLGSKAGDYPVVYVCSKCMDTRPDGPQTNTIMLLEHKACRESCSSERIKQLAITSS